MVSIPFLKTISWAIVGLAVSIVLSFLYYGSWQLTGFLVLLAVVLNATYFLHEELWLRYGNHKNRAEEPGEDHETQAGAAPDSSTTT